MDLWWSELWFLGDCQDGELVVIWVATHELADRYAGHAGQGLWTALAVIDGFFLPAVEFIQTSIFLNKGYEMGLNFMLDLRLAFLDRGSVLLENLLI